MTHIDASQYFCHTLLAFLRWHIEVDERQFHILFHSQLVDEIETLEHEAYFSFAHVGTLTFFQAAHIFSVEQISARGRVVEQTEDIEQGGFTTARRSHDGNKLAVFD